MCERGGKNQYAYLYKYRAIYRYIYRVSSRKSGVVLRARSLKWVPRKKHISEAKYKKPQSVPPSLSLFGFLSIVTQLVQKNERNGWKERVLNEL